MNENKQRANFKKDFGLLYQPTSIKKVYGVKYSVLNDKQEETKTLHYEVQTNIKRIGQDIFSIRLQKDNIRINYKKPDLIIEKLSNHVLHALYPIELEVDKSLKILGGVKNQREIVDRWTDEKKEIFKKFQSPTTDKFCEKVDEILKNKTLLYYKIIQDWFLTLYFHQKYLTYTATLKQQSIYDAPLFPYQPPIRFQGYLIPHEYKTPFDTVQVRYKGISTDPRLDNYIKQPNAKKHKVYSEISILYDLDNITHIPIHARLECKIKLVDDNSIIKTIQLNSFAIEQNNDITREQPKKRMNFFIDEKQNKK